MKLWLLTRCDLHKPDRKRKKLEKQTRIDQEVASTGVLTWLYLRLLVSLVCRRVPMRRFMDSAPAAACWETLRGPLMGRSTEVWWRLQRLGVVQSQQTTYCPFAGQTLIITFKHSRSYCAILVRRANGHTETQLLSSTARLATISAARIPGTSRHNLNYQRALASHYRTLRSRINA